MRLIRLSLVACLVATSVVAMAQEPIPISEVRQNDDMGIPLLVDQVVTIQGVVTAPTGLFNTAWTDVYLQDETGGVNLFDRNQNFSFPLGSEVRVTGMVTVYRGLTELTSLTASEIIATNLPQPQPKVITVRELRDSYDFDTNTEHNEGLLVRLNNVTATATPTIGAYILTDASGTMDPGLYIVGSTGLPAPQGTFNVVGVVKQFDANLGVEGPYYLGYEVLPRYISDITYGSGPQFVSLPRQTDVAVGGATISWTTDIPCESIVEYGTSSAFDQELRLGNSTTTHVVALTGLPSATLYHVRAVATDGVDSVTSAAIPIITPAAGSSGSVDVYFSKSVDTTYSTGVAAQHTDLAARLLERIAAATHSIDLCFDGVELDDVATALVAAKNRGVAVRVIYETVTESALAILNGGGIPVGTDPDDAHDNMHNRFAVFDAGDGDESNDYLWTGSWNATANSGTNTAENAVVVQDAALTIAYTIEFEEMWGGTYTNLTVNNTPRLFLIGGKRVEQYMGPSDNLRGKIVDAIGTAGTDLLFAIQTFTDTTITNAFKDRLTAGVAVRAVVDAVAADYDTSQDDALTAAGADIVLDNVEGGGEDMVLNHKYVISDPLSVGSDPLVLTGSMNWTNTSAVYKNENMLVFHDATIANIYFQEWMARYHEADGTWEPEPVVNAPVAAFTVAPTSAEVDETITFTDTSTNTPTSWAWTFGDGVGASSAQNPTYAYAAAGTFTVTLTATNAAGSSTATAVVTVTDEPVEPVLDTLYFLPAAAKAAGNQGSFFVSDLTVNNAGTTMATYAFLWLPRGTDNSTPAQSTTSTLAAGEAVVIADVLGTAFGVDDGAVGALAVASDSDDLLLMSRTYNLTDNGTFGQSIPGYAAGDLIQPNLRSRILFFVENDEFRTNLGLLNGTAAALRVQWERFTADGVSVETGFRDLPPWGNVQLNSVFSGEKPVNGGYIDVWTETVGGAFAAYGSLLDNLTSDPTTVLPQ